MSEKQLEWGQTPFDQCSREELIQHCARLYAATSALNSVALQHKDGSTYWKKGSGGDALERARQAMESARNGHSDECIHRSYLLYAGDLLFKDAAGLEIRSGWVLCPECGQMTSSLSGETNSGKACSDVLPGSCSGVMRELSWDDLKPKADTWILVSG